MVGGTDGRTAASASTQSTYPEALSSKGLMLLETNRLQRCRVPTAWALWVVPVNLNNRVTDLGVCSLSNH
jgi:hypothetical protein